MHISTMTVVYGVGIIVGLAVVWAIGSYVFVMNVEEAKYSVLEKRDGYEIREYAPYVIAEARVAGSTHDEAARKAFSLLGGYIFGENEGGEEISMTTPVVSSRSGEKIAMTIPVLSEESTDGEYRVYFVMPSTYTIDTLPAPTDARVKLIAVDARRVAVRSFSGWYATSGRIARAEEKLLGALLRDEVTTTSPVRIARYNPPLSMPFILRNEVLVDVELP